GPALGRGRFVVALSKGGTVHQGNHLRPSTRTRLCPVSVTVILQSWSALSSELKYLVALYSRKGNKSGGVSWSFCLVRADYDQHRMSQEFLSQGLGLGHRGCGNAKYGRLPFLPCI